MNAATSHKDSVVHLGGETPIIPGEEDTGSDLAKTPPVSGQVKNNEVDGFVKTRDRP